jgi:hypothetical protein
MLNAKLADVTRVPRPWGSRGGTCSIRRRLGLTNTRTEGALKHTPALQGWTVPLWGSASMPVNIGEEPLNRKSQAFNTVERPSNLPQYFMFSISGLCSRSKPM